MIGNVHAAALIGLPIVTLLLSVKLWKKPPLRRHALVYILSSLVLGFYVGSASLGYCGNDTDLQWLVPTACLAGALICLPTWRMRGIATVSAIVIIFALCRSYQEAATGTTYVSDMIARRRGGRMLSARAQTTGALTTLAGHDTQAYPGGWLSQAAFVARNPKEFFFVLQPDPEAPERFYRRRWQRFAARPLWHSWLTRLCLRQATDVALWYPGGKLREAAEKIEWRERAWALDP